MFPNGRICKQPRVYLRLIFYICTSLVVYFPSPSLRGIYISDFEFSISSFAHSCLMWKFGLRRELGAMLKEARGECEALREREKTLAQVNV